MPNGLSTLNEGESHSSTSGVLSSACVSSGVVHCWTRSTTVISSPVLRRRNLLRNMPYPLLFGCTVRRVNPTHGGEVMKGLLVALALAGLCATAWAGTGLTLQRAEHVAAKVKHREARN